jgi:hypothetical protein
MLSTAMTIRLPIPGNDVSTHRLDLAAHAGRKMRNRTLIRTAYRRGMVNAKGGIVKG